ncbi:hypothetical protein [Myxococcus sp. SDU36]|nr:hypothetical protein [Myxococcus sp. SDU36]
MYDAPENPTKRGWVTLKGVSWMAYGLFALTLASRGHPRVARL